MLTNRSRSSRVVSRGYFSTVGARLREGRFFDLSDRRSESPVAIVNESFANRNFPGRSPLGRRFKFGRLGDKGYWYTIVGVVKEIRDRGVHGGIETRGLSPARTGGPESATSRAASSFGRRSNRRRSCPAVRRGDLVARQEPADHARADDRGVVARQLSAPSQNVALLGAFALLALLLASVGLYGVLSYAVTQRTNEIGVRMAFGASPVSILVFFSRRGLRFTLVGLVIGLGLTVVAARLITTLLYDFRPDYAPAAALVSAVLVTVAAVACLSPRGARRASIRWWRCDTNETRGGRFTPALRPTVPPLKDRPTCARRT